MTSSRSTPTLAAGGVLMLLLAAGYLGWARVDGWSPDGRPDASGLRRSAGQPAAAGRSVTGLSVPWPVRGQAAVAVDDQLIGTSGSRRPAPIASLAKVMTAYVVLAVRPIGVAQDGFTLAITGAQVRDTARRRAQGESLVPVRAGERLTERQALLALLLPSANNMAAILATEVGGTETAFVARMNASARALGMRDTTYTDPSGFDPGTVSTAADQLVLERAAMRLPTFADLVARPSATVPVAGVIVNTDELLGQDGFVGTKTGSDDDAGGCFMFQSVQHIGTRDVVIAGVVLGQRGGPLIAVALSTARLIVNSVAAQLTGTH